MNRNIKTVTAFVLTLLLIIACPAAAFATGSTGSITGNSTVENVTLEVLVPSNLSFALDPLGLNVTGANQISTQDYYFINQTFAPVKVSVSITAQTSGGAVLVSTTSGLALDDTKVTDKHLYFGALGATDITGGSIDITTTGGSFSVGTGPAAYYNAASTSSATLVPFTPNTGGTTGAAVISFALASATESTTTPGSIASLASGNDGIAAFQFFSQLNTYAKWEANDLTVTGTYTLTPLRSTTYTGYSYVGNSLNQLVPEVVVPAQPTYSTPGFITGSATVANLTTSSAVTVSKASTSDVLIPFYFGSNTTISAMSIDGYPLAAMNYEISGNNIVLNKDGANGVAYTWDTASSTGYKAVVMTLATGTYTFVVNFTN